MTTEITDRPRRVFICHASEDKQRFVLPFAKRLRASGVDVWLDKWEMLLGDKLVEKVINEGIAGADCCLIVLSEGSIARPWVREELDQAMIRSIEKNVRVIAIRLDRCQVPEPLKNRKWVSIPDVNAYDEEVAEILASILETPVRPPLGEKPPYAVPSSPRIHGLEPQDQAALKVICELFLRDKVDPCHLPQLEGTLTARGLSRRMIVDSVRFLGERRYLKVTGSLGREIYHFRVQPPGLLAYARSEVPEYASVEERIGPLIVNEGLRRSTELAEALGQPEPLIHALLHSLIPRGLQVEDLPESNATHGRETCIMDVSPSSKRTPR